MEYYNNIFCVSKPDLTDGDPKASSIKDRPIMSGEAFHSYTRRYPEIVVRNGGGPGRPVLLNYDNLRSDLKQRIQEKYGDVRQYNRRNRLQELIQPDYAAATYYNSYLFDNGEEIKPNRIQEYSANATVLNAVGKYVADLKGRSRKISQKTTGIWQIVSDAVNNLDRTNLKFDLPSNPLRLKAKFEEYAKHGYEVLIHKGTGNSNAAKRTQQVDNLIISLYCRKNLPFGEWVYNDYMKFLSGSEVIYDRDSGEIIDREDFYDHRRGTYSVIGKGTVWNIINDPEYVSIIDRLRNNRIDHVTGMVPYDHRKGPDYSLSMISMDDRTFSRKTSDGKWLNAYVGADIMSEVILGIAFKTERPDINLVWDCFREMFRTLSTNNLMWPCELECENSLMRSIEGHLNDMFQYVTFCTPGIGRSKFIENIFRRKKYGDEKMHQVGIGRHNQKGAFKIKSQSKDEDYKQVRLPVEQLIAEEMESINRWNHDLHPNQKRFPGKTRWQVLCENMHPDLGRPQKHKLFKHIGLTTSTTIRNQDFVKVQYESYVIDNFDCLSRLKPHNYTVNAYYLPEPDGNIGEVYLYQDDKLITRATKVERYQKSKLEATEEDERIRTERAKRTAHFYKTEKDKIEAHVTRNIDTVKNEVPQPVDVVIVPEPTDVDEDMDLEGLITQYSNWKEFGIESI